MDQYLTEKELSNLAKLSVQTLRNYRSEKKMFPYVKLGKSVRYPLTEIEKVLENKIIKAE